MLGPPDFAWKQIQIVPTDDDDEYDNNDYYDDDDDGGDDDDDDDDDKFVDNDLIMMIETKMFPSHIRTHLAEIRYKHCS